MKQQTTSNPMARLRGVHHTAFPTWKPKATVEFYRDGLGLRVPHAITARGWGRKGEEHPDFLHFFFEAGNDSLIAFFYYVGTKPEPAFTALRGYLGLARHTAWMARDEDELWAWNAIIKKAGAKVTPVVQHETLSSIYFRDPNGYNLEIACQRRPIEDADIVDANLTIDAMINTFGDDNADGRTIEDMWRHKAKLVRERMTVDAE